MKLHVIATTGTATALALLASSVPVSAQSALERVLESLSGTGEDVTGIFANTADNVLGDSFVPNTKIIGGTETLANRLLAAGDVLSINVLFTADYKKILAGGEYEEGAVIAQANADGTFTTLEDVVLDGVTIAAGAMIYADGSISSPGLPAISTASNPIGLGDTIFTDADGNLFGQFAEGLVDAQTKITTPILASEFGATIDASITNVLRGLDDPSADTGVVSATGAVDTLIGNIATTGLGAVNTGDINPVGITENADIWLSGANASFSVNVETAVADTTEAVKEVVDHSVTQVGTTTGQTMVALNSALNETNVNASVTNVMSGVNATIGRSGFERSLTDTTFENVAGMDADAIAALTGGITTTGLGAVNTGTIVSGAQQDVTGVITSIVGNAATSQ